MTVETGRAESRTVRNAAGDMSRINMASVGRYAVAVGNRIYQAESVAALKAKIVPLGWYEIDEENGK